MSKVINSIHSNYQSDLEAAEKVANSYSNERKAFNSAIESGDDAKIAKAQVSLNRAQERLATFITTNKQEHDLWMQLIQAMA